MDIDCYLSPADRKEMGGTHISLRRGCKPIEVCWICGRADVLNKPTIRGIINIGTRVWPSVRSDSA